MRKHIPFLCSVPASDKIPPVTQSLVKPWIYGGRGYNISVEGRAGMSGTEPWLLAAQQEGVGWLEQLENKTLT